MSSRARTLSLFSWLAFAAACGSSSPNHEIALQNYDRSCATLADCAAVYVGAVGCCGLPCPNTSVRASAVDKLTSDLDQAKTAQCKGVELPCASGPVCQSGRVACVDGVCQLELPADAAPP